MPPQAPEQKARPGQIALPLWMGVVLALLLLIASPLANAHAVTLADPANQAASTSLELPYTETSLTQGLASPSEVPHCHHGHGTRHLVVALPRVEQHDIECDSLHEPVHRTDSTPPIIASTGPPHALPDPSPVPVYLLTQRFRP